MPRPYTGSRGTASVVASCHISNSSAVNCRVAPSTVTTSTGAAAIAGRPARPASRTVKRPSSLTRCLPPVWFASSTEPLAVRRSWIADYNRRPDSHMLAANATGDGQPCLDPDWSHSGVVTGRNRLTPASAFVNTNMPFGVDQGAAPVSAQDAWDVATFFISQPRPAGPSRD
jgi:hypothetical protein